jgi:starch phosphorylase
MSYKISPNEFRDMLAQKLSHNFGVTVEEASNEHLYKAIVIIIKDILTKRRSAFIRESDAQHKKHVYYLSMEFLMGRSLKNNLFNLGLEETVAAALSDMGAKLERIYEQEPDAGLGNGGLGRLAACFLDGLASNGIPALGYSLRYEYGIFRQKIVDGWQTVLPDFWLPGGEVWLQPMPEKAIEVSFDGTVEENWDGSFHYVKIKNPNKIMAIPYDMMVSGKNGDGISVLSIWRARATIEKQFDINDFNNGNYFRAVESQAMAETITKVLYPEDNHPEGKSLRLSQQYFLVSATIQDIIRRHLRKYGTIANMPELVAIHLNDTHPVLAIPEMMRILLDECGYSWDSAWDIVTRTVAYTNHTVLPEALECWSLDLFKQRLPRIFQIVCEINERFCRDMDHKTNWNYGMVNNMSIINNGFVRMANLAVAASHSVNGVSRLHSEILKKTLFSDFYAVTPDKFKNVTNGIAHRRWLNQINPKLSALITELIGDKYIGEASQLEKLMTYKEDKTVLTRLAEIKRENKIALTDFISKTHGISIDPDSIFDVQAKRLHEYKRQQMNALHILSIYQWLKANPNADFHPRTFIFGAKAAPGYYFAKEIIRFIVALGELINNDSTVNHKLKVVFLEDYRVTVAEILVPATEISEQISLAGKEASGTGNMKFMLNGAVTLGTLDGANVEIFENVGADNILLFGMNTPEAEQLKRNGYRPETYYQNNVVIKAAVSQIAQGIEGGNFQSIADYLKHVDTFMALADFADYSTAHQKAERLYRNPERWNSMALVNIAKAGIFSADRAIREYADTIWLA